MIRGLGLSVPRLVSGRGEDLEDACAASGQRLSQSGIHNEASIKTQMTPFSDSFDVREPERFHMPLSWAPRSRRTEGPLFRTSPYVSLHLPIDSYPLISFIINQ